MKNWIWCGAAAMLVMAGCAGLTLNLGLGEIAGNIVDLNGDPVRGAVVSIDNRSTDSNSSGAYVVSQVREGTRTIRASLNVDGIPFSGETTAQIFDGDRTRNINIAVSRTSTQARLFGVVRDRFGSVLEGAKVFAYLVNPGGFTLSSVSDVTNGGGEYELRGLAPGFTYRVNASGRGYNSDRDSVSLAANEQREFNFVLDDPSDPLFPPPQNVVAVAWTSPDEPTRSPQQERAYEAIKRISDPRRTQRRRYGTRSTTLGYNVEVDVYWDPPTSNLNSLLGYGIYRAISVSGTSVAVDFARDPEASFYSDIDDFLRENTNYYYEMTALNVRYPDTFNSESDFSNRYGVRTLEEMLLLTVLTSPLTFRWQPVTDIDSYQVFLFDEYPDLGVPVLWSSALATGLSTAYNGPALVTGRRYYYVVLGVANGGDSRTISVIDDFLAN
jgi:hypothetical protein